MAKDIDDATRELLNKRRGDWPEIATESGVSYSWLSKFVNNRIPNPGLETLKKVFAAAERRKSARA
jgi:transcriptional regulator with XRE-family HTH domain